MREITSHKVNECNDGLKIAATDEPGSGGANHEYLITLPEDAKLHNFTVSHDGIGLLIPFQKGPIKEVGVNGITHEALLAIVIDRLQSFQAGPYACNENMHALVKLQEAADWLKQRTVARVERGVEGTHQV